MSLMSFLFGEWEVVREVPGRVQYKSSLLRNAWEEDVVVTIERHTRTNKERSFIHRLDGSKTPTSLAVVKSLLPELTK